MSDWFVYLLRCADGSLYCGITTDLDRRTAEHNAGTGAKYTRSRGPVHLEKAARCPDKSSALKLELAVKRQPASRKLGYLASAAKASEASADASGAEEVNASS